MTTIVLRSVKGSALLSTEVDANFTNLNTNKAELASPSFTGTVTTSGSFASTIATGTAPLSVTSTTNVANLNASSLSGATFASPGAIGGTTAASGAFTTLSVSSGLSYSSTLTGGTGVITIGTTQIIKDASGNVGLGVSPSGTYKLQVSGNISATSFVGAGTGLTGTASVFTVGYAGNSNTVTTVTASNLAGAVTPGASGNLLTSNGTSWTSGSPPTPLPSQTGNSGKYLTTNGTATSWINAAAVTEELTNKTITQPILKAYKETIYSLGSVTTATVNIDTSLANIFDLTLTASTIATFTNVVGSGYARPITLIVRQPASGAGKTLTVTGANYIDGAAPVLSTGVNQIDVLTYWSPDGGTTFFGTFAMANGVYTTGTQTIGGSKTFSSTVLLADGGVMFASDGAQDTGFSWASDGVMNVRCNASTVGQFTSSGFTGNSATATNATNQSGGTVNATTITGSSDAAINGMTVGKGGGNGGTLADNAAIGRNALQSNTTGYYNSASGSYALFSNTTGSSNTASGMSALNSNTTGISNTAIGRNALQNNTTGSSNTASGMSALQSNTTGYYNSAVGVEALQNNTTGFQNTASGVQALQSNTTGFQNTACGVSALFSNTTGYYNAASGYQALNYNTTGNWNTANGVYALFSNTEGSSNTAVGESALVSTTGNYNTGLGRYAGYNSTTGSGNVSIGGINSSGTFAPAYNITTESNHVYIGSTAVTKAVCKVAWTISSDARDKTNFAVVPHGLDFVTKLKPTAYQFTEDRVSNVAVGDVKYGFLAQDILELEGASPVLIDAGNPDNLYYTESNLIPILVNAIKELTSRLELLEGK